METHVRRHYRKRPKTGGWGEVRHHSRHLLDGRHGHELIEVRHGHPYATMSLAELIAEHKRLVHVLTRGTEAEEKREAARQAKELLGYMRARHGFKRTGSSELDTRRVKLMYHLHHYHPGKLSYAARQRLPTSQFAVPEKRKYPIENISHARNALARVSAYGSEREKAEVRRAVHKKYPSIGRR